MAHGLLMNGMISHAFAAVMTATVVMFPTPKDLWETVTDQPLTAERARVIDVGVSRNFPANLTDRTPMSEINEALDYCAHNFASPLPVYVAECEAVMAHVAQRLSTGTPTPDHDLMAQRLELALALYCRQQWAGARQLNGVFDVATCRSERARLVEPI